MADDRYEVCGPQDVRKLVRAHLLRVDDDGKRQHPRNRPSSTMILEGPPGSGKTAVLDGIARDLVRTVPFARFDFTTDPAPPANPDQRKENFWQEIDDALTAMVWDLSQWRPIYGSLRFPRFAIAQLVRRLNLDPNLPAEDLRQEVISALERHRRAGKLRRVLQDAAAQALGQAPGLLGWSLRTLGPYIMQLLFDWLVSRTTGRRVLLGRYQHWFGTRGQGDGISALVDLNLWTRTHTNPFRGRATQLMFAAFFADLLDDFRRGRRSGERSFNGILFLENVASEWGSAFFAELASARAKFRSQEPDGDPLTVVATSRVRVPFSGLPVVRVLLRPLDLATVNGMVDARSWAGGDVRRLAARIHGFTSGHPEAVSLLLEAAVAYGTADVELNDLLAWRPAADNGGIPPDRSAVLIERLLPTALTEDEEEDLVTLSATRDRDQMVRLSRRTKLLLDSENPSALGPDLWTADNAGGQLLRRLLLRRLAARQPAHPADWPTVHGALRRFCRDTNPRDEIGELYHALAVGDLQFVVAELAERTDDMDTDEWLELLKSVTAAPRPPSDPPPEKQVDELVATVTTPNDKVAALAEVVAGLWVAADPATPGNRHRLHKRIARNYDGMADLVKHPAVITDEAESHREVAKQWR